MRELTIGEKMFIDANYEKLKPREMAASLRISNELVRAYMHSNDYESICRKTPAKKLTDQEKEFIRSNSAENTINYMSLHVGKSFNTVRRFIEQEQLPSKSSTSGRPKRIIRIFQPEVYVKPEFKRPPAEYSNTDWGRYGEQVLSR